MTLGRPDGRPNCEGFDPGPLCDVPSQAVLPGRGCLVAAPSRRKVVPGGPNDGPGEYSRNCHENRDPCEAGAIRLCCGEKGQADAGEGADRARQ